MNKFIRYKLKKNKLILTTYDKFKIFYYTKVIPDEKFLKKKFKKKLHRKLDLENPIMFNDKLQWLKLNWYDPIATQCADKFAVREYVENKVGEKYLNNIYGIFNSVDEINIDLLPDKFVLKGTHGSGYNIVCEDKGKLNWKDEFRELNRSMKKKYYLENKEWVYKEIKPRIICENFLEQGNEEELRDYRFFCFNGEPKIISVDFNINDKKKTRRNIYDLNWNLIDAEISYPKETSFKVPKPIKLNEMIELSKKLSKNFPHARIDFYYINNEIIFGEITFFHQSGMGKISPVEFEVEMGKWLKLP